MIKRTAVIFTQVCPDCGQQLYPGEEVVLIGDDRKTWHYVCTTCADADNKEEDQP